MWALCVVVPVRHAHDDVLHTVGAGLVDDGFQGGYQGLAALQTKTLLRGPLPLEKLLEPATQSSAVSGRQNEPDQPLNTRVRPRGIRTISIPREKPNVYRWTKVFPRSPPES